MSNSTTSQNWRIQHEKRVRRHSYRIPINDAEHDAISRICKLLDISMSDVFREWLAGTRVKNIAMKLLIHKLRQIVGLMRHFGTRMNIPALETIALELQNIVDNKSDEILPTRYSEKSVPVRDSKSRRDRMMTIWLDDDEHNATKAMKDKSGIPVTQEFRAFVIEQLIPTTEATLMKREILDNMMQEFKSLAVSYNPQAHKQYADTVVSYSQNILKYAEQL